MGNSTPIGICNGTASREGRDQGGRILPSRRPRLSFKDISLGFHKRGIAWTECPLSKVGMLPIVLHKPVIFIFSPLSLD